MSGIWSGRDVVAGAAGVFFAVAVPGTGGDGLTGEGFVPAVAVALPAAVAEESAGDALATAAEEESAGAGAAEAEAEGVGGAAVTATLAAMLALGAVPAAG